MSEVFFYDKRFKEPDSVNMWFVFPADYSIGMSSLGFLNLFRILDMYEIVNVERVFADTKTTDISFKNLDVIGFSNSFEFDFINIYKMLDKYNISLSSNERDENTPLIFGGGAVLTANPEPFYDLFDFIIIGDGEEVIKKIMEVLYQNKSAKKSEKLKLLSEIDGVYVPILQSFSEIRRIVFNFKDCTYSPVLTDNTTFSNTFLVEVSRGCPYSCKFCLTSHVNKPVRYSSLNSIKEAIETGLKKTDKIGLLGALVPSNPCFDELCEYLIEKRKSGDFQVSIGSLRANFIKPVHVEMLVKCGQNSATIAIEAGSQKMRDFINKKLSEEEILNSAQICFDNGLKTLKLYAMAGFPNETQEDIEDLVNLVKKIKKLGNKVILSVNSFVPKMQTPFGIYKYEQAKLLEKKFNYLKKEMHKAGVAFRPCSIAWNEIQAKISLGDRSLSDKLKNAYKYGYTIGSFKKVFRE